ncbi:AraC family transcriptional regulator [Oceanobacillus locisalsi]|uniref:Helix-turn-helix domain-containing protein n=1 Tax=Oceanobacillus locisalsi TaxID=546107 RepID=A0ABW3NB64_9BACI
METYKLSSLHSSLKVMDIQLDLVEEGWSFDWHEHPYFEFIYCKHGHLQQWIDNELYDLTEGNSILVCAYKEHKSIAVEPSEYLVFHFDIDIFGIYSLFNQVKNPLIGKDQTMDNHLSFSEWLDKLIIDFHIKSQKKSNQLSQDAYIEGMNSGIQILHLHARILECISLLAFYFEKSEGIQAAKLTPSEIDLATKALKYLDENFLRPVRMEELAQHMNFHRSYISTIFKKAYGISPTEYLTKVRVREASKMLTDSEESIEEISIKLNFNSAAHLSNTFKSIYGMSPSAYRKKHRYMNK